MVKSSLWLVSVTLSACVSGPSVEPAQPGAPSPQNPPPQQKLAPQVQQGTGKSTGYDEVLATVGSNVITLGSIRAPLATALEAAQAEWHKARPGKRFPKTEALKVEFSLVQERIHDILLADHINRLGHDPVRVKTLVDYLLANRLAKEREDAGSDQELRERLRRRGMSLDQHRSSLRDSIKRELAVGEELRKIGTGSQLLATPRQMLAFYNKNKTLFTTEAEVDFVALRFDTKAAGDSAETRAKAAATKLRAGEAAAAVATTLGAVVIERQRARPDTGLQAFLTDFAFAPGRKAGDLSAPIPIADQVWLVHLTRVVVAAVRRFDSRQVQAEIRNRIFEKRRFDLLIRITAEEQERARVRISHRFGGDIGRQ